jgi:hypothetical protein
MVNIFIAKDESKLESSFLTLYNINALENILTILMKFKIFLPYNPEIPPF